MGDDGGPLVITLRDVWSAVVDVKAEVALLSSALPHGSSDHEQRLRTLERKIWIMTGSGTVIGAAAGIFGAYLTNFVLK